MFRRKTRTLQTIAEQIFELHRAPLTPSPFKYRSWIAKQAIAVLAQPVKMTLCGRKAGAATLHLGWHWRTMHSPTIASSQETGDGQMLTLLRSMQVGKIA
jgi:hypothetical protein